MISELSEDKLKRIFSLLDKRGVRYIDVQHEMVDHIASDIERITYKNPELNFEQKLSLALNKFPNDLTKIVRQKEKSMNRYWQRKTLGFVKIYFQIPILIFTVLLFGAITSGSVLYGKLFLGSVLTILLITVIYTLVKSYNDLNYSSKKEKEFLVLRMFFGQVTVFLFAPLSLFNVFHFFKDENTLMFDSYWYIVAISVIVVFTFIWCHACLTKFPDLLKEEINSKYPYLKLAN